MKYLALALICLMPWLAGCAAFNPDPAVPPAPKIVGVAAQNMALKKKVREGHGGQPDVFVPLAEAQKALQAALEQTNKAGNPAGMLAQARAELEKARQLWSALPRDDGRKPSALRKVATHAHSAKRLAQIARYTTQRESNLTQLGETSDQLRQLKAKARAAATKAATHSSRGKQLIGQKVVPGPFGEFSFRAGTPALKPESVQVIEQLVTLLKKNPSVGVAILAHTSKTEPPAQALKRFVSANPKLQKRDLSHKQKVYAYNLALSNARARAVAKALVKGGIEARRIGARGFGSSRPVTSNATAEGRAANERVVAVIIPGPDSKNSPLQ